MAGPGEVGSTGRCRIEFVEAGARTVERIGRPDCSTLSFCFALS